MTPEHTALVNQLYGSVMGHDAEMLDKAARAIEDLSPRLERAERVVELTRKLDLNALCQNMAPHVCRLVDELVAALDKTEPQP